MKIWVLFALFFVLSAAFTVMVDLMMGLKLSMSVRNIKSPFSAMTIPEYAILFALLSIVLVPPIVSFFKQRK
jgi:hypothetical protein